MNSRIGEYDQRVAGLVKEREELLRMLEELSGKEKTSSGHAGRIPELESFIRRLQEENGKLR